MLQGHISIQENRDSLRVFNVCAGGLMYEQAPERIRDLPADPSTRDIESVGEESESGISTIEGSGGDRHGPLGEPHWHSFVGPAAARVPLGGILARSRSQSPSGDRSRSTSSLVSMAANSTQPQLRRPSPDRGLARNFEQRYSSAPHTGARFASRSHVPALPARSASSEHLFDDALMI